jgi:hypothetical protein
MVQGSEAAVPPGPGFPGAFSEIANLRNDSPGVSWEGCRPAGQGVGLKAGKEERAIQVNEASQAE